MNDAATPDLADLTLTRIYDAPRELVFRCMITPEHLTHFWGPTGMSTPLANIKVDARPGGVFETIMVNDETGEEYPMIAVFIEVDEPNRLSWGESGSGEGMTNTLTFNDLGDGRTEVVVVQTNVPAMFRSPEAQAGLQSSFDKFNAYLLTL